MLLKVVTVKDVLSVTSVVSNHEFKFKNSNFIGCLDLTMLCPNLSNITIVTVKGVNYCCSIHNISKSEAIHLLKILCLMIVDIYKSISNKSTLINIKNEFTTITLTI